MSTTGQSPSRTFAGVFDAVCDNIGRVVHGKDEIVRLAVTCAVAGGHLLVEDVPGVGKTTLAKALARSIAARFGRVQFTPDLLPSDVVGSSVWNQHESTFEFRPGPIFANVLLGDEINRASPKTQSALLEAMAEEQVTVDGTTYELARPFTVVATQNPLEHQGTFPLPESQLDRFLIRLSMGYPDRENERLILRRTGRREPVAAVLSPTELLGMSALVEQVRVPGEVEDYLLDFVEQTRQDARLLRGLSTRGAEALYRACQALALVRRRDFVVFEDIIQLAVPVAGHRVRARSMGERPGEGARRAILEILRDLPAPL